MNNKEYNKYVTEECERQWKENQEEDYGTWDSQADDTKADYYNQMYSDLADNLLKTCQDCCYLGRNRNENHWYCNCGSSNNYQKEVTVKDIIDCNDFEE